MSAAGMVRMKRASAVFTLLIAMLLVLSPGAGAAAPANDDFADATSLPAHPSSEEGSNVGATKEAGEPDHAGNPGGHSVWFKWTPEETGLIGIQRGNCFGSGIAALIAVYTGSSVGSLTPVASNESVTPPNCFSPEPQAEFEAIAGTAYWIAVDGRDGAEGSFQLNFNGPPANDDFADAGTVAGALPTTAFGDNRLAGREAGEPEHAGDPGGHSVWYSWTASSSERVRISTCSSFASLDTLLAVYTGAELGSLTEVASNDEGPSPPAFPGCGGGNSEVTIDPVAGTTYRIAVDGSDGAAGRFSLQIRGRPANDDFASAQPLSPPLLSTNGDNEFATRQAGEPEHAGAPGGHSVWFRWTPESSGRFRISTCGTAGRLDTLLALYTGTAPDALTEVAANDDGPRPRCGTADSELDLTVAAGTTYRIAVDGKDGDEGSFSLNVEAPPANDDFADAVSLPGLTAVSSGGTNALASEQTAEPRHAGSSGDGSVWFTWTAPETAPVEISACPYFENSPDTLLAVYTGTTLASLTPVAASDDSPRACQEVGSSVELEAVAHTTYRIAVDSKGSSEGFFSLALDGRPANDDFSAAQVLSPGASAGGGSTTFATRQAGEPEHAGAGGGHSIWFDWTPEHSGPVDVVACGRGAGVDALLAVYTGSKVDALTPVASNDDAGPIPQNEVCESGNGNSETVFTAAVGTTYRIAVDTKGSVGRVGLYLEGAPANDDFAAAQAIPQGLPSFAGAFTKLASKQAGEPDHAGEGGGHSVWYSWTAPASGPVTAETCTFRAGIDTVLGVYTGTDLAALTPVASSDDGQSRKNCRSTDSAAQFTAQAGTRYLIAVDGRAGTTGSFQLIVEGAAGNDDFGHALTLGGALPVNWEWLSNRFATKQAGEPDHAGEGGGSSVWFKWTAPRSGTVSVDTCESGFDTLLAVYTGTTLAGLAPVQSNDDGAGSCAPGSSLSFEAAANVTYRIAVDGKAGADGDFGLYLQERPANDDFEAAEVIPGSAGWYWPGSTMLATRQTGEPSHEGDAGGHSVWFSWTPHKSWEIEVDICAKNFEPLLGVYTGETLGGLAPVATADAGSGDCAEGRSLGFTTTAGVTYHLAVDGAGGDAGHFLLHLRAPSVLPHVLNVSRAGDGTGFVDSSLAGIDCGTICSHDFAEGTAMVLSADPVAGSAFAGWSGGGCSGTGPCQVAVNADTQVIATFELLPGAGGGETGGGGGAAESAPPLSTLPAPPSKRLVHCRRGFRKKKVHGRLRCVKRKHEKPRRHH